MQSFRTKAIVLFLAIALVLALLPLGSVQAQATPYDPQTAIQKAADEIINSQALRGDWGTTDTSVPETLGVIGSGLIDAYARTLDSDHLTSINAAGAFLLTKTNNFSPADGMFAAKLDTLLGVSTYKVHVKTNFFDKLAAGTYGTSGNMNTAGYIETLNNYLNSQDPALGLISAHLCGADTTLWAARVKSDLNTVSAIDDQWPYLVTGKGLFSLSLVGETFDPTGGDFASASDISGIANLLIIKQNATGAFPAEDVWDEDDVISTAYVLLALDQVNSSLYQTRIQNAANWLLSEQNSLGYWTFWGGENYVSTAVSAQAVDEAFPAASSEALCTTDCYVDATKGSDGNQGNIATPFATIQKGINSVSETGNVHVAAGTYAEQVTVNKALTILGPNADKLGNATDRVAEAVLTHPDGLPTWNGTTKVLGQSTLTIASSNVTIKGLKFTSPAYLQGNMPTSIKTSGANNVTVENNLFVDVSDAIAGGSAGGSYNLNWVIRGNKHDGGVFVNSRVSHFINVTKFQMDVLNNDVSDVFFGVYHNIYTTPANSGGLAGTISGNTFETSGVGVWHNDQSTTSAKWVYQDNTFKISPSTQWVEADDNNQFVHRPFFTGFDLDYKAFYLINNNSGAQYEFTGNIVDLANSDPKRNDRVFIESDDPAGDDAGMEGEFHLNQITDYTIRSRYVRLSKAVLDTSRNWWGTADPSTLYYQTGVDKFIPWCTDATCTTFSYPPVHNATQDLLYFTIQSAIDAANNEDVIFVPAGTYNEDLEIGKSITILGPNAAISPNGTGREAEAVIKPLNEAAKADPAVLITASNITVTIKGLTFDMQNTFDNSDRFVELINKTGVTMDVQNNQFLNAPSCINGNWYITGTTNLFDLTLIDNYFHGSKDSNGIALWGDAHTVTIQNNVWKDNGAWAVNFNNVTGTISGNQVLDTEENGDEWSDEQAGFLFASANNLSLTDNTFDGLPNPYIRLYDSFSGTLTATGNTFANLEDPAMGVFRISDKADLSGVTFTSNSFLNNPLVGQNLDVAPLGVALDLTNNWWGSASGPIAGQTVGNVLSCGWLNAAPPDGVAVDKPIINTRTSEGFCSIQAAVNAANQGDTITVADGTYNMMSEGYVLNSADTLLGMIEVKKPVKIIAADDGNTTRPVIDATSTTTETPSVFKLRPSNFVGGELRIEGFEIKGNVATGTAIIGDFCGADEGFPGLEPGKVVINNNLFTGTMGGINFWGNTACADGKSPRLENFEITNNQFDGLVSAGGYPAYGIMLERLSSWSEAKNAFAGVVSGNTFQNIASGGTGMTQLGSGIVVNLPVTPVDLGTANVSILENTFGTGVAANVGFFTADASGAKILNNNFGTGALGVVNGAPAGTLDATGNWWGNATGPAAGQTLGNVATCGWLNAAYPGGTAVATPVTNSSTGKGFCTIQSAIDAATAGDVINVAAGIYNEDLEIGKSITILGPNALISPNTETRAPEAIVAPLDEVGVSDTAVKITTGGINVTMKGLTFDMANTAGLTDRFVESVSKTNIALVFENNQFLNAPSANTGNWNITGVGAPFSLTLEDNYFYGSEVSNGITMWDSDRTIVIKDNVWKDNQGWAVNLNRVTGTISNNLVLDTEDNGTQWYEEQSGFLFAEENNVDFTNNVIDGLPNRGIRIYDSFKGQLTGTGNLFQNTEDSFYGAIQVNAGADLSGVKFEGNSFLNNTISTQNQGTTVLNASGNWWGTADPALVKAQAGDNVDFTPWLASGADTDPDTIGFQGDFSTLHVDDDGPQLGTVNRIQEGINMVSGSTVLVEPGTYVGSVLINKPLTLQSTEGAATTIIDGGATAANPAAGLYVVQIRASNVILDGFTVTNPLFNSTWSSDPAGIGVGNYGDNALSNIRVTNNIVTKTTDPNWVVNYSAPHGMVVNGVVTGLEIDHNVVHDLASVVPSSSYGGTTGIALYGYGTTPLSTNVTIHDNEVYDIRVVNTGTGVAVPRGIRVGYGSGDATVSANYVHDLAGIGIQVPSNNNGSVTISKNRVTGTDTGVLMANALGGSIEENELVANKTGIQIDGSANVAIHYNRIFGNTIRGLFSNSSINLDAINNWWGCNEGPNGLDCDSAAFTSRLPLTTPWLKLTAIFSKTSLNPTETLIADASLLFNSAGATPSTTQYVPNTTPVSFTANPGAFDPASRTTSSGLASSTYSAAATAASDNLCVVVDNESVCQAITVLPALKPGSIGYQSGSNVQGVSAGFFFERLKFTDVKTLVVELYGIVDGTEQVMQTNTANLSYEGWATILNTKSSFSTPFDIFGTFDYVSDLYWTNARASGEFGQSVAPSKAVATLTLADDSILTATDTGLTNNRSLIIKGSLYPQDYGYVANTENGLRGVTAGFGVLENNLKGAQSIVVKLYAATLADPLTGQLLQTNTALPGTLLFTEGWTQFSTPFDVFGTFDYATDAYWTNDKESEYGQTLAPSCVVAEVTLFNGSPVTARNCELSGHRGMIINTLDAEIASAPSYVYDPVYPVKGDVAFEDTSNTYTLTYTAPEFLAGEAMNDLARYLGALYRQVGSTVTSIDYLGVKYTWDTTGILLGSNWEDASGKTLVSTVVDNAATYNPADGIVMTLTDGYNTETVTFKFIVLDTLDAEIASAPNYVYPDGFTYVGASAFVDTTNTYTLTYTAPQFMAKAALNDLARYLGALYRQADATVNAIDYKGVTYTWQVLDPELKGSNWRDAAGKTLVSVITAEALGATPPSSYTMTVKDGLHTNTVTFSFTVTNTLDAEIASAPSYAYPDGYIYVGDQAFVDSSNTYTLTYTAPEFLAKHAMFDLARYLGALHRQTGATVLTVKYAGVTYTWDTNGTLVGSNWEDSAGNTLVSAVVAGIASYNPATGLVMTVSDGLHTETVTFKFIITNTLEPEITSAVTYVYTPVYDYVGAVAFDDPTNVFTATYSPAEFLAEGAMNDLARYLGALHRQGTSTIISIKYDGVSYTWDAAGTNKGSNWYNGTTSLVSAMVMKYLATPGDLAITVSDGIHTAPVTFKLLITNTLDAEIASAPNYVYPDGFTYVGASAFDDATNTYTLTYTAPQFMAKAALNDLARYLGALYRQADATVVAIDYKGVTYTWNTAGTLKGSNWEASGVTLVSVVTADALSATPPATYIVTVKDGLHTNTVTFKFLVTNTLDAEIASAPSYVYPDGYTYVGTSVFDNLSNTYTLTYNDTAFAPGAMNDLARYLGALYRQNTSTVISIKYGDVTYTWNNAGTLKGSNWEASGVTLISAVVDGIAGYDPTTGLVMTVSDGLHTETVTFKFIITDTTAPTVSTMVAKGATGFADVTAIGTTFAVDQGYTVATIEITMSEPVTVVKDTEVTLKGLPYGVVTVSMDGLKLIVTPYPGNEVASGIGSFTFVIPADSVKDLAGISLAMLEATLDVNNVLPVVEADSYSTDEDTPFTVSAADGVLANDTDYSSLTAVLGTGPTNGSLTLNSDGSFTYTPALNFNGTDTFTYKANDGTADSAEATVTITVKALNDAPVADDQDLTTAEDTALKDSVTATDVDLDNLTFSKATDPANGTVTVNADGSFTYTPTLNFNGADSFTFTVTDGTLSDTGKINISVTAVNDAPVAEDKSVTTVEDTMVTITPVATDVDLDSLTFVIKTAPLNGTAEVVAGVINYTPALNYYGTDSFTFVANDGTADSNEATVTITVTSEKDTPMAVDDFYTTNQDTPLLVSFDDDDLENDSVLDNDTDVDLNARVVSLVTDVTKGTLTLNEDGSFLYTPNLGTCGVDTFTYRLVTYPNPALAVAGGWTDDALVTITVNCKPVIDPVPAQNATVGELLTFTVAASDADMPAAGLTFSLQNAPTGATIDPATGAFTWTPTADQAGQEFTFKVCVNDGITTTCQTVTVKVAAVVVPPDEYKLYLPIIAR